MRSPLMKNNAAVEIDMASDTIAAQIKIMAPAQYEHVITSTGVICNPRPRSWFKHRQISCMYMYIIF